MRKCTKCGALNSDTANACRSCSVGPEALVWEAGGPASLRDRIEGLGGIQRILQAAVVLAVLSLPVIAAVVWSKTRKPPEPPKRPEAPLPILKPEDVPPPPVKPGEVYWKIDVGGPVHAAACAADGRAFAVAYRGMVAAIDTELGRQLWRDAFVENVTAPPALEAGVLYIVGGQGDVAAVDVKLPKKLWSKSGRAECTAGPAVAGDRVIVAAADGAVRALAVKDGEAIWKFEAGDAVRGTPVIDGDGVCFATETGVVFRLKLQDGAPDWRLDTKAAIVASLALQGSRIIAATRDGDVLAIEKGQEVKRWTAVGKPIIASPAVDGDRIYVAAGRSLVQLDGWRLETGDELAAAPCVSGDRVYVGGRDNFLRAVDTATGREVWNLKLDWYVTASPIAYRGKIIFGDTEKRVWCVQTDRPEAPDWPQEGGGAGRGGYNRGRRE